MYDKKMSWQGWVFEVVDIEEKFGKTKVEAYNEEIEEIFYIEEQYLSEGICRELYEKYLYIYEG